MADDLRYRVAELERIVGSMIRMGTVAEADYDHARCRVRSGGILTGWLPWATTRAMGEKTWWAPRIGEQVMIVSPCGDLAQARVLMAFYQDAATPPASSPDILRFEWPNGAFVEHDVVSGTFTMEVKGNFDLKVGGTTTVTSAGNMTLTAPRIDLNP